jgi:hypothetical protein
VSEGGGIIYCWRRKGKAEHRNDGKAVEEREQVKRKRAIGRESERKGKERERKGKRRKMKRKRKEGNKNSNYTCQFRIFYPSIILPVCLL